MNDEFNNDIWESLLKAAIIENVLNETADYPAENGIHEIILPKQYDLKMRKLIGRYQKRQKVMPFLKSVRKIASIVIIVMGITFSALLQFDEVRAACREVIIKVYEKYIEFSYSQSESNISSTLYLAYIPRGYYKAQEYSGKLKTYIEYKNTDGEIILFEFSHQEQVLQIDNEHYTVAEIAVADSMGLFFEAQNEGLLNYLIWSQNEGECLLSSSLNMTEMKKIAENIN